MWLKQLRLRTSGKYGTERYNNSIVDLVEPGPSSSGNNNVLALLSLQNRRFCSYHDEGYANQLLKDKKIANIPIQGTSKKNG